MKIVVIKGLVCFVEKKFRTKGEKKLKVLDPEEYSLCVFNPKQCKKDKKPKLSVLLEVSGNSKQTTINGEVSYLFNMNLLINFALHVVVVLIIYRQGFAFLPSISVSNCFC